MTAQHFPSSSCSAAFEKSNIPCLPLSTEESSGLMRTALPWGGYANLDSVTEIEHQLEVETQRSPERDGNHQQSSPCDSSRWRFENTSKLPHLLFVLKWCCLGFPWIFWDVKVSEYLNLTETTTSTLLSGAVSVGLAFTCLGLFGTSKQRYAYWMLSSGAAFTATVIIYGEGALWGFWSDQTAFWSGMMLFLFALFGSDLLLALYARFYKHDGSEFNRQTGMVTIARRFRKPFIAPFYEFDPVMQLMIMPHGGHDYALWLYHRYTGMKVCLANRLHSLGLDEPNLRAFWDTLQRYMDVSQPLPDLPILEQSRHLDPVTAMHDAATGRPARYWRDIKPRVWMQTEGHKLRSKLLAYPWQTKPCIFQQRFDPSLSIETYYRRQEARGIRATPRADDFDDVHRP